MIYLNCSKCLPWKLELLTKGWLISWHNPGPLQQRQVTSFPSICRSTTSEGRPINSNVFSTPCKNFQQCELLRKGLLGGSPGRKRHQRGQSSDFNVLQYSGTCVSVAAKSVLLEPEESRIKLELTNSCFSQRQLTSESRDTRELDALFYETIVKTFLMIHSNKNGHFLGAFSMMYISTLPSLGSKLR